MFFLLIMSSLILYQWGESLVLYSKFKQNGVKINYFCSSFLYVFVVLKLYLKIVIQNKFKYDMVKTICLHSNCYFVSLIVVFQHLMEENDTSVIQLIKRYDELYNCLYANIDEKYIIF